MRIAISLILIILLITLLIPCLAQEDIELPNEFSPNINIGFDFDRGDKLVFLGLDYHRYISEYAAAGLYPLLILGNDYVASFMGPSLLVLFRSKDEIAKPYMRFALGIGFDQPEIDDRSDLALATGGNFSLGIKVNLSESVLLNSDLSFLIFISNEESHPTKVFLFNSFAISFVF